MGRWIMLAGAALILLGAILHFAPGLFSWFGKLPGDINIETENGRVFIPVTSMILISVVISLVLTVLVNVLKR